MGVTGQQVPACQHQIRQTKQCEQLSGVLRQAAITGLAMLEQVLDHMERMLDLGAQAGLGLLENLQSSTILAKFAQRAKNVKLAFGI